MQVALIRPNIGRLEHSLFVSEARMELVDLAAITVETFTARRVYELARECQRRGVPVIMGGIHPTLIPQEAKEHCDSGYTGDAERPVHARLSRAGCVKSARSVR